MRRGYGPRLAERVFRQIEGFGSYGFPNSHAASFAHLAYVSPCLKRRHPAVFGGAAEQSGNGVLCSGADRARRGTARRGGTAKDVNASDWDCTLQPDVGSADGHALRLGLRLAAGLDGPEGLCIRNARSEGTNGVPYASVHDAAQRVGVAGAP